MNLNSPRPEKRCPWYRNTWQRRGLAVQNGRRHPGRRAGHADVGLAGVAAALAVAIVLIVYFRSGHRSSRDILRHGLAATVVLALLAFVAYDMRHAAQAYLGIDPAKPAVEFEIRLPKAALAAVSETQVELVTDRNQELAQVQAALGRDPVAAYDPSAGAPTVAARVTISTRHTN